MNISLGLPDLGLGVGVGNGPRRWVTDYFNGFELPGDTYTGGPTVVADNEGTLVTSPAGVLPIEGVRQSYDVTDGAAYGPELITSWTVLTVPWDTLVLDGIEVTSIATTSISARYLASNDMPLVGGETYELKINCSQRSSGDSPVFFVGTGGAVVPITTMFIGPNIIRFVYVAGSGFKLTYRHTVVASSSFSASVKRVIPGARDYTTKAAQVVFDGNSLTASTYPDNQLLHYLLPSANYDIVNVAVAGQTTLDMIADAATEIDALYSAQTYNDNILVAWEGTNHMALLGATATAAYTSMAEYCLARKTAGWKVVVLSGTPRQSSGGGVEFEAKRQEYNDMLRGSWHSFADAFVDIGADPYIGVAGSETNTLYYYDTVHLTSAGYHIVADAVSDAIIGIATIESRTPIYPSTPLRTTKGTVSKYAETYRGPLIEPARTNLFLNSTVPVTQNITTTAQQYTVTVKGTGSVTLSGTAIGVATEGSPLTVTATAGTLTCTVAGTLSRVNVEAGAFGTSFIDTGATTITRPAANLTRPTAGTALESGNNFAIYGRVIPEAGGQKDKCIISTYVNDTNYLEMRTTGTMSAYFAKKINSTAIAASVSGGLNTANMVEYLAYQHSIHGMGIMVRSWNGSVWSAWSDWATNANTQNAPVASTYQIGALANINHFTGDYPFTEIIRLNPNLHPQTQLASLLAKGRI